ncbi:MAG: ATP-binding protein [Candidatus Margulisbacteria bacterium]|nr:ATP-binding protein [Candidatus Margulisiibacteriota bacterium]
MSQTIDIETLNNLPAAELVKIIIDLQQHIQEKDNIEEEIEKNYHLQNTISSILQAFLGNMSLEQQLKYVLELIISLPWFDILIKGSIYLMDEEKQELFLYTYHNLPEEIVRNCGRIALDKGFCGLAATKGEILYSDPQTNKQLCLNNCKGENDQCQYCIPIMNINKTMGIINIYVKKEHQESQDAKDFFSIVANIVAGIIDHKKTEKELEKHRNNLEDIVKLRTEELSEANINLMEAIQKVEKASKLKSEFLANMSHEIRTPINGILGMTELLKKEPFNEEQKEKLRIISISTNALLDLVNDILDLSKIEAGRLELESIPFNINNLIEEKLKMFQYTAKNKGLELMHQIQDSIPEFVKGDPARIQQIVINLVNNAIKFTKEGGITITVNILEENNNSLVLIFSVKDTGIGIESDKTEVIFDSFRQADGSHSRQFGGTGLGLAICKQLVTLMKGRIWVESKVNEGSEFKFTVEFTKLSPTELNELKTEIKANEEVQKKIRPLKILLAEDYIINQKVAIGLLSINNHKVTLANNGKEAVDWYKKERFDIVLMDIQMPEMDGMQATTIIRELEKQNNHRTPIIALTAHAIAGDREKYMESGMDDYLTKPINSEHMEQMLQKHTAFISDQELEVNKKPQQPPVIMEQPKVIIEAPLDIEQSIREFKGNAELVHAILDEFLSKIIENQIVLIKEAIDTGNYETIRAEAHSIKGGTANIKANFLSLAAKELEFAAKDSNLENCKNFFEKLLYEKDRLKNYYYQEVKNESNDNR